MKEKFKIAYRVRRILTTLGIDRVRWHDAIEVAAYEAWCIREDAKYFQSHRSIRNQYSWF